MDDSYENFIKHFLKPLKIEIFSDLFHSEMIPRIKLDLTGPWKKLIHKNLTCPCLLFLSSNLQEGFSLQTE